MCYTAFSIMLLVFIHMAVQTSHAQQNFQQLCDSTFDVTNVSVPSPFPGSYYYVSEDRTELVQVSEAGETSFSIPAQLSGRVLITTLSPDGALIWP
ncbi:MAG: hypothetical protein OHK0046_08870 [Anaerolineae bacterium]